MERFIFQELKTSESSDKADNSPVPQELIIPDELKRRKNRLAVIEKAKVEIERRAEERYQRELADYQEKVSNRNAIRGGGEKPKGKEPQAPKAGPRDKDQVSLTDEDSRIMPKSGGGFEQAYNAQALSG